MKASLQALLDGIIDYAGLFPPAQLPLDQAIRNYARYRQEPESGMLARFICPAARLKELTPLLPEQPEPLRLSVLGGSARNLAEFANAVKDAAEGLAAFVERHGERVAPEAFETRLSDDAVMKRTDDELEGCIAAASVIINTRLAQLEREYFLKRFVVAPYYETGPMQDWKATTTDVVRALCARHMASEHSTRPGFKLRTGGLEAAAFPSPEQIALVIATCRHAKVPLKFTAGLHHPIRHFDAGVQTKMHGFINVFVAGVLAHARGLSAEQLQPIIEDEDASHFVFAEESLRWRDYEATTAEIREARKNFVTSFGSCSFDEPREDLRVLGWL